MTSEKSIGIIANPYSSRDIRRLISSASSIQTVERANIVERILVTMSAFGISKAYMMPDKSSLSATLLRNLSSRDNLIASSDVELGFVEMPITSTVEDTLEACRQFKELGVEGIVVLGGDGTHRAVASVVPDIPMVSISTGTNNAFPHFYEATLAGLALGVYLGGHVPAEQVIRQNKTIKVEINDDKEELALVDLAITDDRWIGARAVWKMTHLKELFLAFCEPTSIGMSSIGGLLNPVSRHEMHGLRVQLDDAEQCEMTLNAPIAPGLFEEVGIVSYDTIEYDVPYPIVTKRGVLAFDGEREIEFSEEDKIVVRLSKDGPLTIDVQATIFSAVKAGIFLNNKAVKNTRHKTRSTSDTLAVSVGT